MVVRQSGKTPGQKERIANKTPRNKKLKIIVRGVLLLLPLLILSYIKFEFLPLQQLLFEQVTFLLYLTGLQFQTIGYTIVTHNFSFIVTFDCTAWRQLYIYAALVLLPPGISWSKRLQGMVLLIPLYIYNTIRAVFSIWIGAINYEWFKPVHYFLWEFFFLVLVFIFWLYWFESAKSGKNPSARNRNSKK